MITRRIINTALALGFVGTLAIVSNASVKAQSVHLNGSNIDIQVGRNRDRHDWKGPQDISTILPTGIPTTDVRRAT